MNQFGYRPPSAGRSLIRNSADDEDSDKEKEKLDSIEESSFKSLIKLFVIESLKISR